jgi:hypothetical protein
MKKAVVFVVALMVLAGCSTTNAFISMKPDYSALPAEDLKTVAAAIEAIVAEGQEEFTLDSAGGIVVDTPEIKQAVRTRAIRHTLVSEFLDSGFGIEEDNGLIAVQRSSAYKKATTSAQRDREALVVMSENNNRWTIYEGLLKANNWPPASLSAIQETFFQARVPLMKSGQQHQSETESP